MVGAFASQAFSGNGIDLVQIAEAGAVAALRAGAFSAANVGGTQALQQLGGKIASGATITASDIGNAVQLIAERSVITAGVDTAIYGGSFGRALGYSALSDVAAVGAATIGAASVNNPMFAEGSPGYVLAHSGLGCAMSAAEGNGCAGGAIGGAASSIAPPLVRDALYNGTETVAYTTNSDGTTTRTTSYENANYNAVTVATSTLLAGAFANALGQNSSGAVDAAQNEVFNNTDSTKSTIIQTIQAWAAVLNPTTLPGLLSSYAKNTSAQQIASGLGDAALSDANDVQKWADQFAALVKQNVPTGPAPADPLGGPTSGGGAGPNAFAIVAEAVECGISVAACVAAMSAATGVTVKTPPNAIFSSGGNSDEPGGNASTSSAGTNGASLGNGAQKALDAVLTTPSVEPTSSGYINSTKICQSSCVVDGLTSSQEALLQSIVRNGDKSGFLTESLVDSIAESGNYNIMGETKFGSNNGLDHVLERPDGSVTIIVDSKQINNGSVRLGTTQAGIQLSPNWIESALENLPDGFPARSAITNAQRNGTLYTAVAGVDKTTGKLVVMPVKFK